MKLLKIIIYLLLPFFWSLLSYNLNQYESTMKYSWDMQFTFVPILAFTVWIVYGIVKTFKKLSKTKLNKLN